MFASRKHLVAVSVLATLALVNADIYISPRGRSDLCLGADRLDNATLFIANCSIWQAGLGVVWSYLPRTDSAGPLVLEGTDTSPETSLAVLANHTGGTYTPEVSIRTGGTFFLGKWNGTDATDQSRWLWHWTSNNQLQYAPDTGVPPDQRNATHYCMVHNLSANTVQMQQCGTNSDQMWSYATYIAPPAISSGIMIPVSSSATP